MIANEELLMEYGQLPVLRQDAVAASGPDTIARALVRRHELERAMLVEPGSQAHRHAYLDHLRRLGAETTGLTRAEFPELGFPLFFRAGASDIDNIIQVFRDAEYAIPLTAPPARILDLGAYAGYAAIYLAHRFPGAEILCVEPSADSFRLLTLNTAPYRQITCINAAVWKSTTRLRIGARYYGDWGTHLCDAGTPEQMTIPALSVPDLLARAGWDRVDLVKCDIEGAELAVFADPGADWLRTLDALVAETHDTIAPGASAAVAACFPPSVFARTRHGEHDVYRRHIPLAVAVTGPRKLPLLSGEGPLQPVRPENVGAEPWSFFTFDGGSFQLHPNPPGGALARVVFARTLDRHAVFTAGLHHAGETAATIVFALAIERSDGTVVARAEHALAAGERLDWQVPLPLLTGPHRIVLSTAMSPGATHNYNGWARWEAPTLS